MIKVCSCLSFFSYICATLKSSTYGNRHSGEKADNRVAITPEHIQQLSGLKAEKILVESGAGNNAGYPDSLYQEKAQL